MVKRELRINDVADEDGEITISTFPKLQKQLLGRTIAVARTRRTRNTSVMVYCNYAAEYYQRV